jgi:predicted dehydrogenase
MSDIAVGLVGAGPWGALMHAPLLAGTDGISLVAIWSRTAEHARSLAAQHDAVAVETYEELLDRCEAVAFAVPPDVQASLAVEAAQRGKHLLLEKPIGLTLPEAEQLADAVAEAGVVSQVVFTFRFMPETRAFLAQAADFEAFGGRCAFIQGGLVDGGPFATPWRQVHGALPDIGPHVLDLLDAALGPIGEVRASGDSLGVVALSNVHDSGAVSQALLSLTSRVPGFGVFGCELFGPAGSLALSRGSDDAAVMAQSVAAAVAVGAEFRDAIRAGAPHHLDVRRGLYVQRLVDLAARDLASA